MTRFWERRSHLLVQYFNYFNNSVEPTQFHVQLISSCDDCTLADDQLLIDNISPLSISLSGHRIGINLINVTLALTSILPSFNQQISMQLIINVFQATIIMYSSISVYAIAMKAFYSATIITMRLRENIGLVQLLIPLDQLNHYALVGIVILETIVKRQAKDIALYHLN